MREIVILYRDINILARRTGPGWNTFTKLFILDTGPVARVSRERSSNLFIRYRSQFAQYFELIDDHQTDEGINADSSRAYQELQASVIYGLMFLGQYEPVFLLYTLRNTDH